MYNKAPFANWVPKPLMLLLIIAFLCPLMAINGVYTNNMTDLVGAFGSYSEVISFAGNAGTIGMVAAMSIAMRIKMRFRSKEIMVGCAVILALLSYMCGTTDNVWVLVAGCLLIGFFKMFALTELVLPIMMMLSKGGDKGNFYAIFYTFILCLNQYAAYFAADLMFDYNWQAPYFIMSIAMLVIAALSIIFQHDQRFCFKVPLYQIDWLSLLLFAVSAMLLNAGLTFMRQQAWFSSPLIVWSLISGIILIGLTIYRQNFLKKKLLRFDLIMEKENVRYGLILLMLMGVYIAGSAISTQYSAGVLGYNSLVNTELNLWMIPGIVVGGIWGIISFRNKWKIKYFIAAGFIAFFIHTLMLYLLIQPQMNITHLYLPMFFKGLGMSLLFISIWFYGSLDLTMDELLGVIGILMLVRTFLSTAVGGAIIGWATYQGQWQSLNEISMYLDTNQIQNGTQIYGTAQVNALLASFKVVLGSLCWFIIPVLITVLRHHYGQFNYRRLVLLRRFLRGDSIRGYRFS